MEEALDGGGSISAPIIILFIPLWDGLAEETRFLSAGTFPGCPAGGGQVLMQGSMPQPFHTMDFHIMDMVQLIPMRIPVFQYPKHRILQTTKEVIYGSP